MYILKVLFLVANRGRTLVVLTEQLFQNYEKDISSTDKIMI